MIAGVYPPSQPFVDGTLDVGDGHHIFWEVCGNPRGKPAVVLHGGPGSGCSSFMRQLFDPARYRLVLFDQRGSGRSMPSAAEPNADLTANTTHHLIDDIERLRSHVEVERWLVFGISWGSTLALAYAERFPERVTELILAEVTMTRRSEIEWLYRGLGEILPEAFARFRAGVAEADRDGDLVEAYGRLLFDADSAVRDRAAADFHDWERASLSTASAAPMPAAWLDSLFRLARARIVTHYFRQAAWLEDDELFLRSGSLRGIPGAIIHGRDDRAAPLATALDLARVWPDADLAIVDRAGHALGDDGIAAAIVASTDRFAAGAAPSVRPARASDADAIRTLVLAGLADHWGELDPTLNADLADLPVNPDVGCTLVVRDDVGTLVGTGTLVVRDVATAEIVRMSVAADRRGSGLGRLLVEALVDQARRRGVSRVVLETSAAWTGVVAFYEACGFAITHHSDGAFGLDAWFARDVS